MRYEQLLTVIDKALQESRTSFNTEKAIEECYGEDASIFGNATLQKLMDGVIDRVNTKSKGEMFEFLKTQGVENKLKNIEDLIRLFENQEKESQERELSDRESAQQALQKAKLVEGMTPQDIVNYHAYQIIQKERDSLEAEIVAMEKESHKMEQQIAQAEKAVEENIANVETVGATLCKTADACSFVA
jgi:wobble nucleotide-excising tRNase